MNRSAMHFDQVSNYRQTQAEPAMLARACAVSLTESLKHKWKKLRANPFTVVAHPDLSLRINARKPYVNRAPPGRKLDGV
jgi:hypothetical protein